MHDVDDTLLMSYVDGELDAVTAREVEASLFRDPERMARVRDMRATSALVRSAFNHVLHGAPEPATAATATVTKPRRRRFPIPAALAASLAALAVGLVLGARVGPHALPGGDAASAREAALQRTLEDRPSGAAQEWSHDTSGQAGRVTPVSSYRSESGRFCREFEEERVIGGAVQREAGVACREEDGRWRVRVRYYP